MDEPTKLERSATHAATPPCPLPDRNTINASRNEIVFIAIGILLLVIQLVFVIWFYGPAFARKPPEQRIIAWQPRDDKVATLGHDEDEESDRDRWSRRRRRNHFRRSSTWNGRGGASHQDGYPAVRRRKSTGVRPAIVLSSSEPEGSDSSSFADHSVSRGLRYNGLAAASLAMPMIPVSPRRMRSPTGSSPDCETDRSNGADSAREMHPISPSDVLRPTFSPRSPRLGPIDLATREILREERRKSEEEARRKSEASLLPVSPLVIDEQDLADGFDDPLGVNRRKTHFGNEAEDYTPEEPRARSDKAPSADENGFSANGKLRKRRHTGR